MGLSNRYPRCGGTANHIIMDIKGKNFYRCATGLTSLYDDRQYGRGITRGRIIPCDTIIDELGQVFSGIIAYLQGDKTKTIVVAAGRIK